ncbi:FAD-dependent monooxygenase [Streptomyces mangrovisoli]|uniref:2-polyprenyl-6-methoxyphenol hydroxylase n=1 Tax=Streptomyces mangrovisoli TaxID=1428628 RepID=A0A1J4NVF1_9ACTN|nr:FAD-dependent monooxygenase [Streptomyces mangrovisoli]OIJ65492.1 2-polyprenyl-6-methoxyphenol hydroxylase [Streptomyces mangrovisoli]
MTAVRKVLVIGGGAAGAAAAILLAESGVSVDLVEVKESPTALGSGITLQGNALRVFRQLGVWEAVRDAGYPTDLFGIRAPDPAGTLLMEAETERTGGPDLPSGMGMSRPVLARILLDRARDAGAKLHFGTTPTAFDQDEDGVDVTLSDGTTGRYDLVVGADGIRSWTRRALGIELETRSVGMGIWRAFIQRPASITHTEMIYGGPCYIAGFCPTGEDSMYAYLVEDAQDRWTLAPEEQLATVRALAEHYHGPWDEIRPLITDAAQLNYTWFETHVLPAPWNRGRIVLIGDAAHTCPPTLAQGAAQALEDAAVLAELLLAADRLDDTLWDAFHERRIARATTVVDASNQIAAWHLAHEQGDMAALSARISELISRPA